MISMSKIGITKDGKFGPLELGKKNDQGERILKFVKER